MLTLMFLAPILSSGFAPQVTACQEEALLSASHVERMFNGGFGYRIAMSEDTALIGAPWASGQTGVAYVFERSGSTWIEQQRLVPGDHQEGANFGLDVALSERFAMVGARYDQAAGRYAGAVYVYERSGGQWTLFQKLFPTPGEDAAYSWFGASIALEGDTVLIGASYEAVLQRGLRHRGGAVYLFDYDGARWVHTQKLVSPKSGNEYHFGSSVAIFGDTALVAERQATGQCPRPECKYMGIVHVFTRQGALWLQTQELTASDRSSSSFFGHSVVLEDDTAMIGALDQSGAVYVFVDNGSSWVETQKLTASDAQSPRAEWFGNSVALSGDLAVIGAPLSGLPATWGAAYVFVHGGQGWVERHKLTRAQTNDFGRAVGLAGQFLMIGAPRHSPCAAPVCEGAGAALVFRINTASTVSRNAGVNPASFTASLPSLGSTWTASSSVDLTTTGHTHAEIVGYSTPVNATLDGGQVMLGGGPVLFMLPAMAGPSASWSVEIPNDCALVGLAAHAQALHLGGRTPFALSNAQDLILGF